MSPGCVSLNTYLRRRFGERVQKVPLDAGLTCPNRDGTKGRAGCIYCDARGSGTGAAREGLGVAAQMRRGMERARRRYGARRFIAYFQSFSNTYAPPARLEALYREALVGPEVVGLSIGTRPDCVDAERLSLVRRVAAGRMAWMEYGLQSASDATLARIGRGHTVADFVRAVELSRRFGLPVCTHVIFGLPGEGPAEMEATVRLLAELRVEGVKFHQLYVLEGTALARDLAAGAYRPISREAYVAAVRRALELLPPATVVQRLWADPPRAGLLAPAWSLDRAGLRAELAAGLA
ncbi:TIGR01212 family radical SAM protein [Dissulfurirhabdus thermomarina]|uniref:TIGR01212 family radical SAM protein n=1 Tax=Dissulfurirhabdus thermomarina TaxID=1765737 RepID=A0A6N9TNI3_DISTH|nr:TIGR01212 family radical SAM protein [Dissulfurirhabdus thermomarina]NDY42815.1 TIGR01212 family radical SAM protein [Dissulfurirhabdus thermomarina]NMX22544.1 TIGR01212 family radical SAM protein [Dissulfurirhabdus thermomarina]